MENEQKLTQGQVALLTYASAAGNIAYTFTFVTSITGRAVWVAALVGVLINIPFAIWILYLGNHLQEGTIFDILENGFGKIISKFLIIIYFIINVATAASMLNIFTGTIRVLFLQNTPSFVIMLFIVFMCTLFVNSGIKTLARLIEILVVLFTVNYFSGFFVSFFKLFKMEYVIPIFDLTGLQFAKGAMIVAGTNAECLLFLMVIIGSTSPSKKQYWSVVKGLATWSVVLSFAILIMEGDVGHEMLSRVAQAGITVARIIQIESFIRGMEIFVLMTYQYIAITKTAMFIYSCYISSKKLFNVKKSMTLLILTAVLIFGASIMMNSFNAGYFFAVFLGSYVIFPFVILILILSSFCMVIKKIRSGGTSQ